MLFCEISPFTYRISMEKEILKRRIKDMLSGTRFAKKRDQASLPVVVYRHSSLIRRRLGNVDMRLQENKAVNLALAVKQIDGLVIRPGETFSIWRMVGRTTKRKGYKEGLTITKGQPTPGVGGGLCQLSVKTASSIATDRFGATRLIAKREIVLTANSSAPTTRK